jgi:hypothetical protein
MDDNEARNELQRLHKLRDYYVEHGKLPPDYKGDQTDYEYVMQYIEESKKNE